MTRYAVAIASMPPETQSQVAELLGVREDVMVQLPYLAGQDLGEARTHHLVQQLEALGCSIEVWPDDAQVQDPVWNREAPSVIAYRTVDPSAVRESVVLVDVGTQKIQVIKVVRELTALGLKEAKDLVEAAPSLVGTFNAGAAEVAVVKLSEAGGTAEIVRDNEDDAGDLWDIHIKGEPTDDQLRQAVQALRSFSAKRGDGFIVPRVSKRLADGFALRVSAAGGVVEVVSSCQYET